MDTLSTCGSTGDYLGQIMHEIKLSTDPNYTPY